MDGSDGVASADVASDDGGTPAEVGESGRRGRRRSGRGGGTAGEGLPGGGTVAQAKDVCLRLLGDRARSRAELADRLAAKGFSAEVANRALDRLTEVGLIDDAAFAEEWVRSRHTFSGKGKRALALELRRKGVSEEDAEPALEGISAEDERERAAELVRRKLRTLPRGLEREKVVRRLVGMLARRGYGQGVAFSVVKGELEGFEFLEMD
ncbi:recombination regulator RecX [Nocardia sp. NPDC050406]|uniref:recombination regulator RecX n=1 Tax=Nocardia sp. NPDC050406 TaxID=3364318 RepID=UPI0037B683BD